MSDHLTDWKAKKRIAELEIELDNERARGIHTCGPNCHRPECEQRREIERLQAEVDERERLIVDNELLRERVEALEGGLNEVADTLAAHGGGAFDATIKEIRLHIKEAATEQGESDAN